MHGTAKKAVASVPCRITTYPSGILDSFEKEIVEKTIHDSRHDCPKGGGEERFTKMHSVLYSNPY